MITRTMKEMENEFVEFAMDHDCDYELATSPMVNNCYHKTYMFRDGATWYEVNDIVYEEIETVVYGIRVKTTVKLARTEYWSTKDATSKYAFQQIR